MGKGEHIMAWAIWETIRTPLGIEWKSPKDFNFKKTKKELDVTEMARNFMDDKIDQVDDTKLTDKETQIISKINVYISYLRDWYEHGIGHAIEVAYEKEKFADMSQNFYMLRHEFYRQMDKHIIEFGSKHKSEYVELNKRTENFAKFKNKHKKAGLQNRLADYPESIILHMSLIFLALIGEGIANAYFFAQISQFGLIGGFGQAFGISFVNVIIAIIAGYFCIRQLHHISILRKIIGFVGFIICSGTLVALHLAVAHYREFIEANPDFVGGRIEALTRMIDDPFDVTTLESLMLIAIGAAISIFATWKGYTIDDKYPGYGKLDRKIKKLKENLEERQKALKENIQTEYDNAIKAASELLSSMRSSKSYLEGWRDGQIGSYVHGIESHFDQAKNGARDLIIEFRQTIREVKGDQTIFPYTDELLNGENGLEPFDPRGRSERLLNLLKSLIDGFAQAIADHPGEQTSFANELKTIKDEACRDSKITSIMKDIEENTWHGLSAAAIHSANPIKTELQEKENLTT